MLQASDGWYWKWLAKWKKKSKIMETENEDNILSKKEVWNMTVLEFNSVVGEVQKIFRFK